MKNALGAGRAVFMCTIPRTMFRFSNIAEYYLGDAWEPSLLLNFLSDTEIAILEGDPLTEANTLDPEV
jgi:hypothetical protein